MVATVGDLADHVIIHTSKARGAELTSSYEEEKAIQSAHTTLSLFASG